MAAVVAPVLAGSRRHAQEAVRDLPFDLTDSDVQLCTRQLLAAQLLAASTSFADEIIAELLVHRHARRLLVPEGTVEEFVISLEARATAHGVRDGLHSNP